MAVQFLEGFQQWLKEKVGAHPFKLIWREVEAYYLFLHKKQLKKVLAHFDLPRIFYFPNWAFAPPYGFNTSPRRYVQVKPPREIFIGDSVIYSNSFEIRGSNWLRYDDATERRWKAFHSGKFKKVLVQVAARGRSESEKLAVLAMAGRVFRASTGHTMPSALMEEIAELLLGPGTSI